MDVCQLLQEPGNMAFVSYRDPNLTETLKAFNEAPDFIKSFDVSDREMTKYIIGTISNLDMPLTPASKGGKSSWYVYERYN